MNHVDRSDAFAASGRSLVTDRPFPAYEVPENDPAPTCTVELLEVAHTTSLILGPLVASAAVDGSVLELHASRNILRFSLRGKDGHVDILTNKLAEAALALLVDHEDR